MKPDPRDDKPSPAAATVRGLPAGVWALGLVSMFMDISSELIHSLLPVFMVTGLGASLMTVGLVEGIAEASAALTRVFSGVLSDYLGRRKALALLGYGLAALTKPVFPLATSIGWVFTARFVDRIGKGIRGAPRDALIADLTVRGMRGAAYGLRQSLDSIGAFAGPLLAMIFMLLLGGDVRAVLWLAVVPAIIAVVLLAVGVREPARLPQGGTAVRGALAVRDIARLPRDFWLIVSLAALFTLARFSEAFLVLRAADVGLAAGYVPLVLIVMNSVYMLSAYPAGSAADRISQRALLAAGLAVLVLADGLLAVAASVPLVLVGAACWGLHMGLTQGLFAKLVADHAPPALRGSAFGIFNLVSGVALLLASLIAGALWNSWGAGATFVAGGAFAAVTLFGLLALRR